MTFVDLDKGGFPGYARPKTAMGPTHGLVQRPYLSERIITSGVASTVQNWDAVILINLAAPAAYSLTMPSVAEWMKQPYGQIPVLVKMLSDNGGNIVTILAAGSDTIDGLASIELFPTVGVTPWPFSLVRPRIDLLGWIAT